MALFSMASQSFCATQDFELLDGERVTFVGSTYIEREQRYGYWEHTLTSWWPERNITFRNLGWSGDTVWGEARAGFDTPREGYRRLVAQTLATKPTVIFIGYGTNESFAGKAGLAKFEAQLNRLFDDLQSSKARIVLLAPPMFEKEKWPGGDFELRKADLELYTHAIQQIAEKRRLRFVPEFCQSGGPASPLTDDGMHLTPFGYWSSYTAFAARLKTKDPNQFTLIGLDGVTAKRVVRTAVGGPSLPPKSPKGNDQFDSFVIARNLKTGRYTLKIDGRAVYTADADTWMHPPEGRWVSVRQGPSVEQSEKLRQAIIAKNRLFFHRYRPQNDTYLFGFRKYEQGNNAVEIPQFDPLIARLEAQIAKLRVPVAHTYQLVPHQETKK
jgi:lysophospholipase L1-like esterase